MNLDRYRWAAAEATGWTGIERVALGGMDRATGEMTWYELPNVAALRGQDPVHNFEVDGEDVQAVLRLMKDDNVRPMVLWHSHQEQEHPSVVDIRTLPHWLQVGVIWCASSTVLTAYDRTGVISRPIPAPSNTTAAIDEAASLLIKAGVAPSDAESAAHAAVAMFDLKEGG
jgi:proteasome lid subunit RPN8/RPN11